MCHHGLFSCPWPSLYSLQADWVGHAGPPPTTAAGTHHFLMHWMFQRSRRREFSCTPLPAPSSDCASLMPCTQSGKSRMSMQDGIPFLHIRSIRWVNSDARRHCKTQEGNGVQVTACFSVQIRPFLPIHHLSWPLPHSQAPPPEPPASSLIKYLPAIIMTTHEVPLT